MATQLDLKEIERKAFRSTYQDGLWDVYLGLVVISMAIFVYRPEDGYSRLNIILAMAGISLAYLLFWAGKKFITLPRMGQVRFGPQRKKRNLTLAILLGFVVLVQGCVVAFTVLGWANPEKFASLNSFLQTRGLMHLTVAVVGASFVGPSMLLIAYFTDFSRGYYIAILMSLAMFLMILFNQPIYPIILGGLIVLPGLVLFVNFLQRYPLPGEAKLHE